MGTVDPAELIRQSTKGSLLAAVPLLGDPNFHRTVVYMLEHSDDGALGLVLNRPTHEHQIAGLQAWMDELSDPQVIFDGGPVQADTLIAIASRSLPAGTSDGAELLGEGFSPLGHGLGTVDLTRRPGEIVDGIKTLRVFRGYSGWGPGQLEMELNEGSWLALASDPGDLFTPNPLGLWRNVMRRSGGRAALLADAPHDLSWN